MADTFSTKEYVILSAAFADGTLPSDLAFSTDSDTVATISLSDPAATGGAVALAPGKAALVSVGPGTVVATATGGGKSVSLTFTVTQADHGDLVMAAGDALPKP